MEQHLQAFLESFIAKQYRANWLNTLAKSRPTDNLLSGMDALYRGLDRRYCVELPKGSLTQDIALVRQALDSYSISTAYILSADKMLNRQTMPVEQALSAVIGRSNTTIISVIPGKVAYFEGYSVGERYWCVK